MLLVKINKVEILEAIIKTIKYVQKYQCQLTLDELRTRLISPKTFTKEEIMKFIKLSSYKVAKPKENKNFKEKLEKARGLASKIAKKFPDILFIGVSGSVAAGQPKEDDDIDLFLITKKNCLWINRLRLRLYIYKNRIPHRKRGRKENKDEFCFNLWLDEDSLLIPKNRQNLRNAMDLILLIPILNKNYSYERLIKANDWAKRYVATGYSLKPSAPRLRGTSFDRAAFLDGVVNYLVFWPQYLFMKRKNNNREITSLGKAFFNEK